MSKLSSSLSSLPHQVCGRLAALGYTVQKTLISLNLPNAFQLLIPFQMLIPLSYANVDLKRESNGIGIEMEGIDLILLNRTNM